jgi:AraC-like DNA-binding protein
MLKRADQLWVLEERPSSCAFVDKTWRTQGQPAASFISVAASHWQMVATKQGGVTQLTVRGPETKATMVPIPEDAQFLGIEFSVGTFMPSLPLAHLVDRSVTLTEKTILDFGDADMFVDGLARSGLLARDPLVEAALRGEVTNVSTRSVQRRVLRATGLTQGTIRQIERSKQAVNLLGRGASIGDTVEQLGYADQAHLTRSLRRFVGQTPALIAAG